MTKENENLNIIQEKSSTKQSVASSKELTKITELNQINKIFNDLKNIHNLKIVKQKRSGKRNKDLQKKLEGVKKFVIRMVNNNEKQLADLEQKLDNYKKIEREFKENAEKKIKEGLTLDSKAIVDLNQAKERISELET